MEQLRCAGAIVSEYVGDGQGENADIEESCVDQVDVDEDEAQEPQEEQEDEVQEQQDEAQELQSQETEDSAVSDDGIPLLFIYDCETTGLSIYTEHITEIAGKVTGIPLSSISQPTYTSLIKTSRTISKNGTHNTLEMVANN